METSQAAASPTPPIRGTRPIFALGALVIGILLGVAARGASGPAATAVLEAANIVGSLWLDALKMTVVPLVVALLIVGITQNAQMARAGRIAGRTMLWIVVICTSSAVIGMLLTLLALSLFPLGGAGMEALRAGVAALAPDQAAAPVAGASDFFGGIIPDNVVAAASNGEILPLVVFTLIFALALSRIAAPGRELIVGFFSAIADALLIMIGWVLWVAPLGILALAFTLGASAGGAAFAALGHYILIVSAVGIAITLLAYPLAALRGGYSLGGFARALLQPQSVAISTRSSLASLPAMLASARQLGVRDEVADVSLPMAVALFRATGPAMNVAVAVYVAHWLGLEPSIGQIIAATAVGAVMSYGAVSLPGEISFVSSIAPIAMALGAPIAPLALLVAVEMIPDIFRTLGNVTMDVAVTAVVDREVGEEPAQRPAMARTRSE